MFFIYFNKHLFVTIILLPRLDYRKHDYEASFLISSDWQATRSRIAVDEGAAMMYVVVPVAQRAQYMNKFIEDHPFVYAHLVKVFEGYYMDVDLPSKVDFIFFEPSQEAKMRQQVREEKFEVGRRKRACFFLQKAMFLLLSIFVLDFTKICCVEENIQFRNFSFRKSLSYLAAG